MSLYSAYFEKVRLILNDVDGLLLREGLLLFEVGEGSWGGRRTVWVYNMFVMMS